MVNLTFQIPPADSHSPVLLDVFTFYVTSICSTVAFPPLENSEHVSVSVTIDFSSNSKGEDSFHHIAHDYFCADWDGLRDYLRDVLWKNIFKLVASAATCVFS